MPSLTQRDLTLLIVEDEEDVARYLSVALKNLFNRIDVATTLTAALARLKANGGGPTVDAVLLDLHLTNGRGLVPVQQLRTQFPYLPIIVMTGGMTTADEAMSAGACDFLHKTDMSPHEIFRAVVNSVARREAFRRMAPMNTAIDQIGGVIEQTKAKITEIKK